MTPRARRPAVVALVTDFGGADGYAGAMKGVLVARARDVRIVDVSHDVPPGDVQHAAWVLNTVWPHFPPGTVFLAVVDPGVGTARSPLALASGGRFGVGPDNGIFTFVAADARAVALPVPASASPVFHGRDVFAAAAAALASGASLESLGASLGPIERLRIPPAERRADGTIEGEVIHVDRFGNCVTNVPAALLGGPVRVDAGAARASRFVRAYGDAKPDELVALVNSADHLELAARDVSASERFGIRRGTKIVVRSS